MLQSLMVYPTNNHFNIAPHIDENFAKLFQQEQQQQQPHSSSTSSSPALEYSILPSQDQQQQQQQQQINTDNSNNSNQTSSSPSYTMIKTESFDDHNLDYLMYSDNTSQYQQPHSQMNSSIQRPNTISLLQQQHHHQQQQQQHAQQLRLQHNRMMEQQQQQYPFQYPNQVLSSTAPSSSSILINSQNQSQQQQQQQQSVYRNTLSSPISSTILQPTLPVSSTTSITTSLPSMFPIPLATITSPTSSNSIPTTFVNSTAITSQPQPSIVSNIVNSSSNNPFVAKVQAQTRTITPHPASPKRKREISEASVESPVSASASISSPSLLSNKKIAIESMGSPVLVGIDPSRSSNYPKTSNINGYTNTTTTTTTTTSKINSTIPILPSTALPKETEINNYFVNNTNTCTKFDSDSSISSNSSSRTGIKPSGNLATIAISPKGPKTIQVQPKPPQPHPLAHPNIINSSLMVPSNHHHHPHGHPHHPHGHPIPHHHQHPPLPFSINTLPVYHPNPGNVTHPRRAAQNRAAQRTFRNRRKAYIKDLETKAVELERSKTYIQSLETENDSLWDRFQILERLIVHSGLDMPSFESTIERVRKPKIQDSNNNSSDNHNKSDINDNDDIDNQNNVKSDSQNNKNTASLYDDDEYDGQGDHDYDLGYQQQPQGFLQHQQRSTFMSDDDYEGQHSLDLDLSSIHHLNVHHS